MTVLSRWTRHLLPSFFVLFAFSLFTGSIVSQNPAASNSASAQAQQDNAQISKEVNKKLGDLSEYGVFDWITFRVQGNSVELMGYASRPSLKSQAANVVKKISGVGSVDNKIEVLPLSRNDDHIRAAVYNRIYTQPALRRYNANQGSLNRAIGPISRDSVRMGGSLVNFPPQGFHAIHIIVRNGNVTLYGVVDSEGDKNIAGLQANSTPGVFKVQNDLLVQGASKK